MENTGNTMSHVTMALENLPLGWNIVGEQTASLSPHEVRGIPFEIIPPAEWDKQSLTIDLRITHPELGTYLESITVEYSNISFATSPVLSGSIGSIQAFTLHTDTSAINEITAVGTTMNQGEYRVVLEDGVNFGTVSSATDSIQFAIIGSPLPEISASCQFTTNVFQDLGRTPLTGTVVTCSVTGDSDDQARLTFIASINTGQTIPLDSNSFTIQRNESRVINLTVSQWDPNPGEMIIRIVGYDGNGVEVISIETTQVSRQSNWNVGIASFSATGDLDIAITRTNYNILGDVNCILTVTSSTSPYRVERIVDIEGSQFAPIVKIKNPDISDKESLSATIGCDSPFDIDDNSEDDTATAIYIEESESLVTTNNLVWGTSITILVVGIYALVMQRKDAQTLQELIRTKPKAGKPEKEKQVDVVDEFEDDISIEHIQEEVEFEVESAPLIEEIPEVESDLSPSGRLDTIRQELNPDEEIEETTSIEDRMSKFFD
jgi:hypothetical protein